MAQCGKHTKLEDIIACHGHQPREGWRCTI